MHAYHRGNARPCVQEYSINIWDVAGGLEVFCSAPANTSRPPRSSQYPGKVAWRAAMCSAWSCINVCSLVLPENMHIPRPPGAANIRRIKVAMCSGV